MPQHIAVIGIPSKPVPRSSVFIKQAAEEINRLAPDRVIVLGSWYELAQETGEQFLRDVQKLKDLLHAEVNFVPLLDRRHALPGHAKADVEKSYFDALQMGSCRLLLLDSRDSTSVDRISERQLRWLSALQEGLAENPITAAFIDRPIWDNQLFPGYNDWWTDVHPILQKLGVRYVIAGYEAGYLLDVRRDGVRYVRSAGISDTLRNRFYDLGNFRHFLWLGITRDHSTLTPIRLGAVRPDSAVTRADRERARQNYQEFLSHPDFALPAKLRRFTRRRLRVKLTNPLNEAISGQLVWQKENKDWRIYPPTVDYQLQPKQTVDLDFNVWLASLNSLNRNLPRLVGMLPPLEGYPPREVLRYMVPQRKFDLLHRRFEIEVDGNLNEWAKEEPLLLNREYFTTGIPRWTRNDLSVAVYSAWDSTGIYLGIDVKDDRLFNSKVGADIRQGDCVEIGIDSGFDRRVPGFDENDHDFGFAFTEHGPVMWRWHGPPRYKRGRLFDIPFAVERIPSHTLYEVFIPASELWPLQLKGGKKFGMDLAVYDDDGKGLKGAMQWTGGLVGEKYPGLFAQITLIR